MRQRLQIDNTVITTGNNHPGFELPSLVKFDGGIYMLINIFPVGELTHGKILNLVNCLNHETNLNNLEAFHGTVILTQ